MNLKPYEHEINRTTSMADLRYYKRFWADEARRVQTPEYRDGCRWLSGLAGRRLKDLFEKKHGGEGAA